MFYEKMVFLEILLNSQGNTCARVSFSIKSIEAVLQRCSVEKAFLEILQNSLENTCVRVSILIKLQAQACNFIKKETLAQVFYCEFCEIFKNIYFKELLNTEAVSKIDTICNISLRLFPGFEKLLSIYVIILCTSAQMSL